LPRRGISIDERACRRGGAETLEQRGGPDDGRRRAVDVSAAFEARRSLGLQAEPFTRTANGGRLKIRALERDGRRRL